MLLNQRMYKELCVGGSKRKVFYNCHIHASASYRTPNCSILTCDYFQQFMKPRNIKHSTGTMPIGVTSLFFKTIWWVSNCFCYYELPQVGCSLYQIKYFRLCYTTNIALKDWLRDKYSTKSSKITPIGIVPVLCHIFLLY